MAALPQLSMETISELYCFEFKDMYWTRRNVSSGSYDDRWIVDRMFLNFSHLLMCSTLSIRISFHAIYHVLQFHGQTYTVERKMFTYIKCIKTRLRSRMMTCRLYNFSYLYFNTYSLNYERHYRCLQRETRRLLFQLSTRDIPDFIFPNRHTVTRPGHASRRSRCSLCDLGVRKTLLALEIENK